MSSRLPDRHILQHLQDVLLDGLDIDLDLLERPGRDVAAEVVVEVDFVADVADQAVLAIASRGVGPGIGQMGFDLALEKGADTGRHPLVVGGVPLFGERDALGIAQLGVGLEHAVLVPTDLGRFVALGEGNRSVRPWNRPARRCVRCAQMTDLCALRALTTSLRPRQHGLSERLPARAARIALSTGARSLTPAFSAAVVSMARNAARSLCRVSGKKRVFLHFIPTSASWANLVERFFGILTQKQIRRGVFTSVPHLEKCLREYLESYNENPRALVWTKSVEEILEKVRRGRAELPKTT